MYDNGLLCVPDALTERVSSAYHCLVGHSGVSRFSQEIKRRFPISDSIHNGDIIENIRFECPICQASENPNCKHEINFAFTPILKGVMKSI